MNRPAPRPGQRPAPKQNPALAWVAGILAVTTAVAGLGWAGVIGGDDAAPATTAPTTTIQKLETTLPATTTTIASEWSASVSTSVTMFQCPAGREAGTLATGDTLEVVGRAEGNFWLAVHGPLDPEATVWVRASDLTPDPASPVWGALPTATCDLTGLGVQTFAGRVLDSETGTPVPGVSLAPTDVEGNPLVEFATVSGPDGTYEIVGLVDEQYGLWVDGATVGYQQGFTANDVGQLGFKLHATWAEAAPAAPGTIGDVVVDLTGTPVSTLPTDSTVPGATAPPATVPVVDGPPVINGLSLSKNVIYSKPTAGQCSTTSTVVSVTLTSSVGIASATVKFTYKSYTGTRTMHRVGTSDVWQATIADLNDPTVPVNVKLEITATDTADRSATQNYTDVLTLKRC